MTKKDILIAIMKEINNCYDEKTGESSPQQENETYRDGLYFALNLLVRSLKNK